MTRLTHPLPPQQPDASAAQWADTQHLDPKADLSNPATQIVGDRDAYLGVHGDIGRRTGEDQVELFTTGDVASALQREFQARSNEFIALHDIGSSGSLRLLGSLAGSAGVRVQRLSIRRQGHGLALAVLQFVEVRRADASLMRVYSTDISAEDALRQQVARVLLAFSRLGVMMVGDMPQHAVSTALHPLQQHMSRSLWPNRELLLVPVAGNASLVAQGKQLATDTPVFVQVAQRAAKPRQVWALIAAAWNRQQGTPAGKREIQEDITQAVRQAVSAENAPNDAAKSGSAGSAATPTPSPPSLPTLPALPAAPTAEPRRHVAANALSSGFAQPVDAGAGTPMPKAAPERANSSPASASLTPPRGAPTRPLAPSAAALPQTMPMPMPVPMPVPGTTRWQNYADRCLGIKGVVSVCVFDTHSLQALAHAGGAPSAERLAQQGALLMAEMMDVARALGLGATRPDAAITVGAHHLLLQYVVGHPGIALHLVVQASSTHLTVVRVQLERIEVPG